MMKSSKFAVAIACVLVLMGAKCNKSSQVSYIDKIDKSDLYHWQSRQIDYCIDTSGASDSWGTHKASIAQSYAQIIRASVTNWQSSLNTAAVAASQGQFTFTESPCATTGTVQEPGKVKFILKDPSGGNTGYSDKNATGQLLTGCVVWISTSAYVTGDPPMLDTAGVLRCCLHEDGRAFLGIFGSSSSKDDIMHKSAQNARLSNADIATALLNYQGIP